MAIGYVYLMTNGRDYKIGLTASEPDNRRRQLQTGNSDNIELIAYTVCKDMSSLEAELHHKFILKRKAGEWFSLTEEDIQRVYTIFKENSINREMSLIPEVEIKPMDMEVYANELMKKDGISLAKGENILHLDSYSHIEGYEAKVIDYMHEEEGRIKEEKQLEKEAWRKQEEEEEYLESLIREDAERIISGNKPIHTFKYQKLENWKNELDWIIDAVKLEIEEKVKHQKELIREDAKRIVNGDEPLHTFEYMEFKDWKETLDSNINYVKFEIEHERQKEEERQKNNLLLQEKIKLELLKPKEEQNKELLPSPQKEYRAKQVERKAGSIRTQYSWIDFLYITMLEVEAMQEANEYIKKDAKRILVNLDLIYGEYYIHIFEDWEEKIATTINTIKKERREN